MKRNRGGVRGAVGTQRSEAAAQCIVAARGRDRSTYALAAVEVKALDDSVAAGPEARRRIALARLGIAGNVASAEVAQGSLTSYAAHVAAGRLRLDGVSAAADAGPGGTGTQGGFAKFNAEIQHTQYVTPRLAVQGSLQAQAALSNLTSAEKLSLGGAGGVRAYPAGEAVGDSGVLATAELRYQVLPAEPFPLAVALFHDVGRVRLTQRPVSPSPNHRTLAGSGLSVTAGAPGRMQASATLAWRTVHERPSASEADRAPRMWVATQIWF
jgi:hemolysin activation/secretion protein